MNFSRLAFSLAIFALACGTTLAQGPTVNSKSASSANGSGFQCARGVEGGAVAEPDDVYSRDGVLREEFTFRSAVDAAGRTNYCYVDQDGRQEPTLRVHPGDTVILSLKNAATAESAPASGRAQTALHQKIAAPAPMPDGMNSATLAQACAGSAMKFGATNLHFHGTTMPPDCHEDDVLHTAIAPGDAAFEYRFQIPKNEPPGLYWYHPHVHGSTKVQVLGGASGALIVEGLERARTDVAGLPERVFVVRDQNLLNPDATPAQDSNIPPVVLDPDGDAKNTGNGTGKPALDLSLNFVPVPYPNYPPAVIAIKPGERQLWRVLNASAITYLNLQLLYHGQPQAVGVVGIDGVPLSNLGTASTQPIWQKHLGIPPGGRIEFVVTAPDEGVDALLVTRSVNTGSGGENDPTRPLAKIIAKANAPEPRTRLPESPVALPASSKTWLGKVTPVRTRKLYFSEVLQDPSDPNSPTTFFLTVDGDTPKAFQMGSDVPNIVAHQGDVEDWIIENRTQEVHAFHIHQVHFLVTEWFGLRVNEGILRDTINVPYWDGKNPTYPRVKLRMDFRDPNVVGLFPYHCHLLEHEDAGMMGLIRVEPTEAPGKPAQQNP
jgi:FtsP/CotA-like multicopper oxidase with cupredoxin domain